MNVTYNAEYSNRLKACFIGCGGHAYRNIYSVFPYLPVELLAVCDLDEAKASHTARTFGALRSYTNHKEMLEKEKPEVVFIVTGYDQEGRSLHPGLAADVMERGSHVWVEKPPVNNMEDVALLRNTIQRHKRQYAVGFKKMFASGNRRLKHIISQPEFGKVQTISLQYPQYIPKPADMEFPKRVRGFLDHLCHPVSLLQSLGGRVHSLHYTRSENGSGFVLFTMKSGVEAVLNLSANSGMGSPLERTLVTGTNSSVEVRNNTHVTWYRPEVVNENRIYGREEDFTFSEKNAPIVWESEFSLGNLYNKNIFLLGYYAELKYFCDCILEGKTIETGGIDDAEEGIRIFNAFSQGPGKTIQL